jgi:O-antigen ligase
MFIVMVNVVRTESRLKVLILLGLAVSWYLSIDGLIKYRSGVFDYEGYRIAGGIGGMFINPNDLALQLVTTIPLSVGFFLHTRNIFLKLFFAFGAVLMLAATVITYSRGGFLGLVAAVVFMAWKLQKNSRFIVIGTVLMAMMLFVVLVPSRYGSRMRALAEDGSAMSRQDDLIRSIVVAARHPLLGVGINNYILRSNGNHASHNGYTQVASETGIAAMVVYILFLLAPLKRMREVEQETADNRRKQRFYYLAVAFQASLVAFMVSSFFASVAFLWYAYYLTGYAVCLHRLYRANLLKGMNISTTDRWGLAK